MNEVASARLNITKHINQVRLLLNSVIGEFWQRYNHHDTSKLEEPELSAFARMIPGQSKIEYGSPEYNAAMAEIGEAIRHHYRGSRHHPEHFSGGIDEMNLIDLTEMICDWLAASRVNNLNGSIRRSICLNVKRFGITGQLANILENTIDWLEEHEAIDKARSSNQGGVDAARTPL